MNESDFGHGRENSPTPERGTKVTVHNVWQRHAQKMSGAVFNADVTGISTSALSPAGTKAAEELGKILETEGSNIKGYFSNSARTIETFDALMRGHKESNPNTNILDHENPKSTAERKTPMREELNAWGPRDFLQLFDKKWVENKTKLMDEKFPGQEFSSLSPDDQQFIAENAEAPVIEEWIDDPTSELAKLHPPRVAAAKFAVLFNRRHDRLAERLDSGSKIDLVNNTHRTVTEPFLASGVLRRMSDGKQITKIADLGGPLNIMDNWESTETTDDKGNPTIQVKFRGQLFTVDQTLLSSLAEEGITAWQTNLENKIRTNN